MSDDWQTAREAHIISAEELRSMLERNAIEREFQTARLRELEAHKHTLFAAQFISADIGPAEMERIRRVVMNAVHDNKTEALVYSFPSALCADGGRAINSGDPAWPETLQGQARKLFERWEAVGKPNGYRLTAMITDFPNGMPGDVGFFLSWAPTES